LTPLLTQTVVFTTVTVIENIWHLRGRARLPQSVTDDTVLNRLEIFLAKQHKPITERTQSTIRFTSPLWEDWLTPNWLALVIYDEGCFWIERGREEAFLRYDLRSLHGLIFCLAGAAMFFTVVSLAEGTSSGARIALLIFAWLYGGNMVLAWTRIPLSIRQALIVG
jgi:hypothetical protein